MKYLILAIAMLGVTMTTNAQTNLKRPYIVRMMKGMTAFNQFSHSEAEAFKVNSFGVELAREIYKKEKISIYGGLGIEGRENTNAYYYHQGFCATGVLPKESLSTLKELLMPISAEVRYKHLWRFLGVNTKVRYNLVLASASAVNGNEFGDNSYWGMLPFVDGLYSHSFDMHGGVLGSFNRFNINVSYRLLHNYRQGVLYQIRPEAKRTVWQNPSSWIVSLEYGF